MICLNIHWEKEIVLAMCENVTYSIAIEMSGEEKFVSVLVIIL